MYSLSYSKDETEKVHGYPDKYIEKEYRRIVYICSSLFLDKSVREATITERLSYRHENTKHGDKSIVGWRQDTSDEKS